jgi:hypothetical protein
MCSDQGAPIKTKAVKVSLLPDAGPGEAFAQASRFREDLFDCLTVRGDELFELVDALLCADGPVTSPVDLTLVAEHRRGHGAMYEALNRGSVDVPRLRQVLAGLPMPRAADGRLVLAVDVSNWLRPDAPTSADRLFCHVYGRSGRSSDQFIPGWPYSFVAALESGRTSWCQLLDAVRLGPEGHAADHGLRLGGPVHPYRTLTQLQRVLPRRRHCLGSSHETHLTFCQPSPHLGGTSEDGQGCFMAFAGPTIPNPSRAGPP